jgi:Limonene-1,2-epoxide hydrolase catalytic domain
VPDPRFLHRNFAWLPPEHSDYDRSRVVVLPARYDSTASGWVGSREGDDGAVLTERLDKFSLGGKKIELPVAGVYELSEGKISSWRDYFEMAAWTRQTSG